MSYATILRFAAVLALMGTGHWIIALLVWGVGYGAQKALYTHLMNKI
jgi:hypothetical protein